MKFKYDLDLKLFILIYIYFFFVVGVGGWECKHWWNGFQAWYTNQTFLGL